MRKSIDSDELVNMLRPDEKETSKQQVEKKAQEAAGLQKRDGSTVSGDVVVVPLSQPYVCTFKYYPVDMEWQKRTCQNLGLKFLVFNGVTPGGPDFYLTLSSEPTHQW